MTKTQACAITAFEVEIETLWVKLTRLRPGKAVEVWLTPRWVLATRYSPMSEQVGTYSSAVTLAQLREDSFWTLERARGKR